MVQPYVRDAAEISRESEVIVEEVELNGCLVSPKIFESLNLRKK